MTIESTPPPSQTPAKAAQGASAGKAKGAADDAASGALGFLALLSAADDALTQPADTPVLGDAAAQEDSTQQRDADASTLAGWLLGMPAPATSEQVQPTAAVGHAGGAQAAGAIRAAWAALDPDAGQQGQAGAGSARKAGKPVATAELQKAQELPTQTATAQLHEDLSKKLQDVQMVRVPETVQAASTLAKEMTSAITSALPAERRVTEPVGGKASQPDVTYFQTQASSAPMGMDGVVATQSAAPLESYVAEQVTYWVSQDVQNAELTLDDMGFSPVQVSISMQGNEAQVAFRTDELHARHAIENASQQLRDSLERQGVMLTGMSVGTSDAGDASGQGRRQRQEGRQAVVTALAPAPADLAAPSRMPQGRALDLFV